MEAPSALLFRMRDWPIAQSLIEAKQLPPIFDEIAGYVYAPDFCGRSALDEKLPEGPVEAPLAAIVMEVLDLVTEVALDCFGHELFPAGPVGRKHFGFHPTAPYEALAARFERDGFRVVHAAQLVGAAGDGGDALEASRARVRAVPKAGLTERQAALVEYVRAGGRMPAAGADDAAIALQLGRLITPRFERLNEIDGRLLDVVAAAGELRGVFEVFAARVNAHEEDGHDTYGTLRRELTRRGVADGRILVALLRSGAEAVSSATLHAAARHAQLDALVEAVRANEPSRGDQARLTSLLLTWVSCVGAPPAAVEAVVRFAESPRAKDAEFDELRAHLTAAHGWEGPKARGAKGKAAKGKAAEPEASQPPQPLHAPEPAPAPAPEPPPAPAPKKGRAKAAEKPAEKPVEKAEKPAEKAAPEPEGPPAVGAVNETFTLSLKGDLVALGEPGVDAADEDALLDAVNRKLACGFRTELAKHVTVRVTGRKLTGPEADHAFGAHHWFVCKTGVDALELRAGASGKAVPVQKGKYAVEVVAVRAPKGSGLPDYVLLLRDELPAKLPKRAELPTIETR